MRIDTAVAGADLSRSHPDAPDLSRISSIPDLPGMPKMKKVSFGNLLGTPGGTPMTPRSLETPNSSQHGSRSGSQHNAKSYWEHLQTEIPGKSQATQSQTPKDPAKRDSTDLGVQEMRNLMRRLNFSK